MNQDTIAAIATGLSSAGVSIIRVSGAEARAKVSTIFRNRAGQAPLMNYASHTIHYGFIVDADEEPMDEVLVSIFLAPNSFTTEDTVEINCHGGVYLTQCILSRVLETGVRLAEPGEFTKRAFLHGRIDLTKAEAVMDLISSENAFAAKASLRQLSGNLYTKIKDLRAKILYEIAFIESALDDPEHISLEGYPEELFQKVDSYLVSMEQLLKNAKQGSVLKEGIRTVIVGKPNAGKSSLLNYLSGSQKAIVTEIAGTTRDVIEDTVRLGEITLHMIDTAGIRETSDVVEKIGVDRAMDSVRDAELVLYVVDASVPLDESDRKIFPLLAGKKVILLLNKSDLKTVVTKEDLVPFLQDISDPIFLSTSVKEDSGMDKLSDTIRKLYELGQIDLKEEVLVTSLRHIECLQSALQSAKLVKKSIEDGMPEDFFSIDLMSAYRELGRIIGEEVEDELVNEIFSKFCMGK